MPVVTAWRHSWKLFPEIVMPRDENPICTPYPSMPLRPSRRLPIVLFVIAPSRQLKTATPALLFSVRVQSVTRKLRTNSR